jgi:hypothetical protein
MVKGPGGSAGHDPFHKSEREESLVKPTGDLHHLIIDWKQFDQVAERHTTDDISD